MEIKVLGEIRHPETIAVGRNIRELERLRKVYGTGRWQKRKGIARVRLPDGSVCTAEAHGIGQKEFKLKRILGD